MLSVAVVSASLQHRCHHGRPTKPLRTARESPWLLCFAFETLPATWPLLWRVRLKEYLRARNARRKTMVLHDVSHTLSERSWKPGWTFGPTRARATGRLHVIHGASGCSSHAAYNGRSLCLATAMPASVRPMEAGEEGERGQRSHVLKILCVRFRAVLFW